MNFISPAFRLGILSSILVVSSLTLLAQAGKGSGTAGKSNTGTLATQPTQPTTIVQPLFISGKVLMEGGGPPPEAVVIERICTGTVRRQGYTDSKGSFQFQIDQNPGFQDASENGTTTINANTNVDSGNSLTRFQASRNMQYQGCEIRAVLPGFLSSSVELHLVGNSWQYDLGTIFLKRIEGMPGATISMTTLNAPKDARHAYEKGKKDIAKDKLSDAEKELDKAVKIYPDFAAAWTLLGDIHQQQKKFDQARKEYSQALTADPRFVNPSFGLAMIAMQEKRWQDAVQLTDQVAKMNSAAFPAAYFFNAVANYNLGKVDLAAVSARKFKTLDTDNRYPEVSLLLAQIDIQKKDLTGAAREMRDYLIQAPNSPKAAEVREWLTQHGETEAKQQ